MSIQTVAVVGLGTMGSQIAVVFTRAGIETHVYEASRERLDAGLRGVRAFFEGQVKKNKLPAAAAEESLSRLKGHTELDDGIAVADFVVEAVFEEISVKKDVFRRLDAVCKAEAILASNTSTLWVSEIAAATKRPERCI